MFLSKGEAESAVFLEGRNITKFPLDLQEAASKLKLDKPVQIDYCPLPPEISAYTHKWDYGHCIYLNNNHPEERQRFSGCHEIAHLYLGHQRIGPHAWNYTDVFTDIDEAEADDFAAGLLMPAEKMYVLSSVCHGNILKLLDKTRQGFKVSLSAASRRVTQLSLFEGAIILKDGYRSCFTYASPGYHDGLGYRDKHEKRLPSGKVLHIYISDTYVQIGKTEIG